MPFIRGIIFSHRLFDGCQALRDQLQLLHWGGLQLAVLRTEAAAEPPTVQPPPAAVPASQYGACERVAVLTLRPDAAAGGAGAGAAEAEAAAASWAAGHGLQWPAEVVVLGEPGDEAGELRRHMRRKAQHQQHQRRVAQAGEEGEGEVVGEEVLPGFVLDSAEAAQAAPWQRLRLALAHANLRRAEADVGTAEEGGGGGPACPPSPLLPPPPPLVVVVTAMKPSRERDLSREGLINLVPRDGLVFAPLDLSSPLESQLPFHAILHKASDELEMVMDPEGGRGGGGGCGPRFGPRVRALADFAARHPGVSLVDPLEAAAKVINRTELARVCDSLSSLDLDLEAEAEADLEEAEAESVAEDEATGGGADGDVGTDAGRAKRRRRLGLGPWSVRVAVRAPRSTTVSSFGRGEVEAAVERLGCPPPYIVKPVVACGTPDSHSMALVLTGEGLEGLALPLPAVVQEFVNHDATIYKAYVAGDKVFHTVRPSIPNVPRDPAAALQLASSGRLTFDSLKSLPTCFQPPTPDAAPAAPAAAPPPARAPSQAVLERLAAHLRAELGLSLFGFDVVVATATTTTATTTATAPGAAAGSGGYGGEVEQGEQQQGVQQQELVVVDVNYFPSYRGAEGAPALFRAAVRGAHERQQRERRER